MKMRGTSASGSAGSELTIGGGGKRLHEAIVQILKSPQAAERYANVGAEIRYNSPEEFAAYDPTNVIFITGGSKCFGECLEKFFHRSSFNQP